MLFSESNHALFIITTLLLSPLGCLYVNCMGGSHSDRAAMDELEPLERLAPLEDDLEAMQPPVAAIHKALKGRLEFVLSTRSNDLDMDGPEQLELIEDVYRINSLLSLSNVNKKKCKTDYISTFENVAMQNYAHAFNISPYIKHFARLQLSLCREFFHENLHEALARFESTMRQNLDLLRREIEAAGCIPLRGSLQQGYMMNRYNVALGAATYMRKTMAGSNQRRRFLFCRVRDMFDVQFDELIDICENFKTIMEPLSRQFDAFSDTDAQRIATNDLNWIGAVRTCENIIFYAPARELFQQAFNDEAVARRN